MNKEIIISIASFTSPFALVNLAAGKEGIVSLDFNSSRSTFKETLKERFGPAIRFELTEAPFSKVFELLDRYFSATLTSFDSLKVALTGTPFELSVWKALRAIPSGKVLTYAKLAQKAGSPGGARAVGAACAKNPVPLIIPCHRVVTSGGGLGGYSAGLGGSRGLGGVDLKRALLNLEGVDI